MVGHVPHTPTEPARVDSEWSSRDHTRKNSPVFGRHLVGCAVIRGILPTTVAFAEVFRDLPQAVLFSEEEAVIRDAVESRRAEFRTVRHCARTALGELGLSPVPVLPGPRREPRWPEGIVGSMTHCSGYRAAAVARVGDVVSLGIDAEPHEALPDGMLPRLARSEEISRLDRLYARHPEVHWDRLTFSAKEAVYKAWFPLVGGWLGFHDASLTIHPERQAFDVFLHDGRLPRNERATNVLNGRWIVENGLLITCVVVAPQPPRLDHTDSDHALRRAVPPISRSFAP